MNNIPEPLKEVKLLIYKDAKKQYHLSKEEYNFYNLLSGDRNFYRKNNMLQKDGSFYKTNKSFIKRLGICRAWVFRLKKSLKAKGLIDYTAKQGRGKATSYWIIDTPTNPPQETSGQAETKPELTRENLMAMVRLLGKEKAFQKWLSFGYSRAEIEASFEG